MTEQNITHITPADNPWTPGTQKQPKRLSLVTTHDGPFFDRIQIKSTQGDLNAPGTNGYYVTVETDGGNTLVFTPDQARTIADSLTRAAEETELNYRVDSLCPFHDDQSLAAVKGSGCTCDD